MDYRKKEQHSSGTSGGNNVAYFGRLKRETSSKGDLKTLEQFVRTEAENIRHNLNERQKLDFREYINKRKSQLSPMIMA